jgi:hypothetical protein
MLLTREVILKQQGENLTNTELILFSFYLSKAQFYGLFSSKNFNAHF